MTITNLIDDGLMRVLREGRKPARVLLPAEDLAEILRARDRNSQTLTSRPDGDFTYRNVHLMACDEDQVSLLVDDGKRDLTEIVLRRGA